MPPASAHRDPKRAFAETRFLTLSHPTDSLVAAVMRSRPSAPRRSVPPRVRSFHRVVASSSNTRVSMHVPCVVRHRDGALPSTAPLAGGDPDGTKNPRRSGQPDPGGARSLPPGGRGLPGSHGGERSGGTRVRSVSATGPHHIRRRPARGGWLRLLPRGEIR